LGSLDLDNRNTGQGLDRNMLKTFTIAALAAALLATGAYSPQAHVKDAAGPNLTVIEKNLSWQLPGTTIDMCDLSRCQDV
jgi:hypothetical protein